MSDIAIIFINSLKYAQKEGSVSLNLRIILITADLILTESKPFPLSSTSSQNRLIKVNKDSLSNCFFYLESYFG